MSVELAARVQLRRMDLPAGPRRDLRLTVHMELTEATESSITTVAYHEYTIFLVVLLSSFLWCK